MKQTCGCGKRADYVVYEHQESHCETCMKEAADCEVMILVQKI